MIWYKEPNFDIKLQLRPTMDNKVNKPVMVFVFAPTIKTCKYLVICPDRATIFNKITILGWVSNFLLDLYRDRIYLISIVPGWQNHATLQSFRTPKHYIRILELYLSEFSHQVTFNYFIAKPLYAIVTIILISFEIISIVMK
jgi:hypothetical protein